MEIGQRWPRHPPRSASSRSGSGTTGFRQKRPELRQHLTGTPEAHLVGSILGHSPRALQSAPGPAERLDRDLAAVELALEPLSGNHELGRVWLSGGHRLGSHRARDLAEIRLVKGDALEQRRDLLLVPLGAIGGRWAAGSSWVRSKRGHRDQE
ncbi:MAG: hypothetical protein A2X23_05150 [Chloroflexi bacterium GWC2_73_18]|nr:MAG: hypothetical protein A2X23_05150 [Chloroflexi bacterium GWC2_73_18]